MKKYRPSNGEEGYRFRAKFCDECEKDRRYMETGDPGYSCKILTKTVWADIKSSDYPSEWVQDANGRNPRCTAYVVKQPDGSEYAVDAKIELKAAVQQSLL